jgi:hypothetical protein
LHTAAAFWGAHAPHAAAPQPYRGSVVETQLDPQSLFPAEQRATAQVDPAHIMDAAPGASVHAEHVQG